MQNYIPAADFLKDRTILVTGAGDGIGRAAAKSYAAHGATVILLGKTIPKLERVYDEIEQAGHPQAAIYPMNLEGATAKDYTDLAHTVEQEFGRLDGLLHNAAMLGMLSPLQSYDLETWYKVMQVNLNAPFHLTRACLELLTQSPDARILFVADHKSRAYWGAYGVSKAGLESLMRIVADETEQNTGVRVNSIDPGAVRTALRRRAYPAEDIDHLKLPDQVLAPFLYLMGPDSREVTGRSFSLDDFAAGA